MTKANIGIEPQLHNDPFQDCPSINKLDCLRKIREKIESSSGQSLKTLKENLPEDKFFHFCLQHVTTTKKALCSAVGVPVEGACRYKRNLEKEGFLVESKEEVICPYTRNPAKLISTNPNEFTGLRSIKTNQLDLFSNQSGING